MSKIQRTAYFLLSGICVFLISIPILERGKIDRIVIDETFFIFAWLVGIALLFNKKLSKYGYIIMALPIVYFLLTVTIFK